MRDYVPLRTEPTEEWWSEHYVDDEELEEPKQQETKYRNSDKVLEILKEKEYKWRAKLLKRNGAECKQCESKAKH